MFCISEQQLIATMYIHKAINNGFWASSLLGGKIQVKCYKHRLLWLRHACLTCCMAQATSLSPSTCCWFKIYSDQNLLRAEVITLCAFLECLEQQEPYPLLKWCFTANNCHGFLEKSPRSTDYSMLSFPLKTAYFINILKSFRMLGEKKLKKCKVLFSALLFVFQPNAGTEKNF